MDYNSMKYRESMIKLRDMITEELESKKPDPEAFAKRLEDAAECVRSNAYVLVREGQLKSGN